MLGLFSHQKDFFFIVIIIMVGALARIEFGVSESGCIYTHWHGWHGFSTGTYPKERCAGVCRCSLGEWCPFSLIACWL